MRQGVDGRKFKIEAFKVRLECEKWYSICFGNCETV